MKSEQCAKLCGSAARWVHSLPENLSHSKSNVSPYLHSFLYISKEDYSPFPPMKHFCFSLKVTGKRCTRVTSWWTTFSTHFSKVNTNKPVLVYKSGFIKCVCLPSGSLIIFKGMKAAGWDLRRTLLDWDEWRVELKTKSSWTFRLTYFTLKYKMMQLKNISSKMLTSTMYGLNSSFYFYSKSIHLDSTHTNVY